MKFPTILYMIKENVDLFGKITHLLLCPSCSFLEPLYCSEGKDGKEFRGFITCRLLLRPKPNV